MRFVHSYRVAAIAAALLAGTTASADEKPLPVEDAVRVRFLIVADNTAREGAACAMDATNLKTVLEAGLKKQKLDATIEVIAGKEVTPKFVLDYYRNLKVGPKEGLVFYYSGHGAYDRSKGHLLTFHKGDLPRAQILAAMQQHKPRMVALLTDCCAVFEGITPLKPASPAKPAPPPGKRGPVAADPPKSGPPHPPRPEPAPATTATAKEPAHPPRPDNYRPPPPIDLGQLGGNPHVNGTVLSTGDGPLALKKLAEETDGELLRHLFYRHTGVVDINGCQKGKAAYATVHWGGGLFTNNFLSLQKEKAAKFDANHDGLVVWSEFFVHLRASCDRTATSLTKGKIHQMPEATRLGSVTLVTAGK